MHLPDFIASTAQVSFRVQPIFTTLKLTPPPNMLEANIFGDFTLVQCNRLVFVFLPRSLINHWFSSYILFAVYNFIVQASLNKGTQFLNGTYPLNSQ